MGGGQSISKSYRGIYAYDPSLLPYKEDFDRLHLRSSDVRALYDIYYSLENSNNNSVKIKTILSYLNVENRFLYNLFENTIKQKNENVILKNNSSDSCDGMGDKNKLCPPLEDLTVSFDVFVFSVWILCSLQPSLFELFIFNFYLTDKSMEVLTNEVLESMIIDVHSSDAGGDFYASRALATLRDGSNTSYQFLTMDDFYDFTLEYRVIHFALFSLQTKLQHAICSSTFWESISERRYKSFNGYSSLAEILRWGEYADLSNTSSDLLAVNNTRKFSVCSASSQTSRFIVNIVQNKNPSEDFSNNNKVMTSAANPPAALSDSFSPLSLSIRPEAFILPAQYVHNSQTLISNNAKNDSLSQTTRRQSFDVTIIIKERLTESDDIFSISNKQVVKTDIRRHSIVF